MAAADGRFGDSIANRTWVEIAQSFSSSCSKQQHARCAMRESCAAIRLRL